MKIGLFFGSFNPIHIGHLILANTIAESAQLDKVWFVVSPQNPFKKKETLLHEFDRYDMVQKAIFDNTRLAACDAEFHLPKPSYTIDTLTYLHEKYPALRVYAFDYAGIVDQQHRHPVESTRRVLFRVVRGCMSTDLTKGGLCIRLLRR